MNRLLHLAALLSACLPMTVLARTSDEALKSCFEQVVSAPDAAIADCTLAIDSGQLPGQNLSFAFKLRGISWYTKKAFDKAIADLDESIRRDPQDSAAFNDRGNAWTDKHDYARAIADYDQAIVLAPRDARPFLNRGNVWRRDKEFGKAIADYDQSIRLDPQNAVAFHSRAMAWHGERDYDKEIADYDQAIRLDPRYAVAFNNRGQAWHEKKDDDKAIADYDQALLIDPKFVAAFDGRAMAWLAKREVDKAIADFDQAIGLDPTSALAFNYRGLARRGKQECDQAIFDFDQSIRLSPQRASTYINRAGAWRCKQQFDMALADLEAAARIEPAKVDHRTLGTDRFYLGDFDRSVDDLRRAVDASYQYPYSVIWLYLARSRSSDRASALAELGVNDARLAARTWPAPVIDLYLGRMDAAGLLVTARDPDAKKSAQQLCEADFYLGEWHLLQGDLAQATPLLQAAGHDCPPNYYERFGALAELQRLPR